MNKKEVRRSVLKERAKLSPELHEAYSTRIMELVASTTYYKKARTIMCFVNFGSEMDTSLIINRALKDGKRVAVPIAVHETKELIPSVITTMDELEPGYFNILTPKEEFIRPIEPDEIDVVLVPGVAFDHHGYRVGYGGGFYDRFLPRLKRDAKRIAIGFSLQILDQVPRESFDLPVEMIISEKGLLPCDEGFYD
jgi:5-formyltetrahydrofolate cyclo-ligase